MRRRLLASTLLVLVLALPALGAAPDTSAGSEPFTPLDLWSDLVEWVTTLSTAASTADEEPGYDLTWPVDGPDGTQTTESAPPEGEVGPWIDPNG